MPDALDLPQRVPETLRNSRTGTHDQFADPAQRENISIKMHAKLRRTAVLQSRNVDLLDAVPAIELIHQARHASVRCMRYVRKDKGNIEAQLFGHGFCGIHIWQGGMRRPSSGKARMP